MAGTAETEAEAAVLREEMAVTEDLKRQAIAKNASVALNQAGYQQQYDDLDRRFKAAFARLKAIETERAERESRRLSVKSFVDTLMKSGNVITEFSAELWNAVVDHMTVNTKRSVTVAFRNGREITVGK